MQSDSRHIDIRTTPRESFQLIHDYMRRLDRDPFLRRAELLDAHAA